MHFRSMLVCYGIWLSQSTHSLIYDRYYVSGADGTQSIIFDQLYPGTVSSLHASDISIVPQTSGPPTVICNATDVSGLNVGFKCWDGLYIPTPSGI
jgi:hypothetical protein